MAFDPSTATIGFDPSSAQPAGGGFDVSTAKEVNPTQFSGEGQDVLHLGSLTPTDNATEHQMMQEQGANDAKAAKGAYLSSAMTGFGGLVSRHLIGDLGLPVVNGQNIDQAIRSKIPGQTEDWYKQAKQNFIRQGVIQARQQAAQDASGGNGITNFATGVLGSADPSWLINPGGGIADRMATRGLSRVATKAVTNTTAHAILGSADDALYQIADQADGITKDFDVKRNLQAATMQAAFGGAHAITSDFVTGLFKDRGTDTTPDANPTDVNKPVSGWSPEDHAAYQHVLNNGSVDDIKQFFNDKQGPQPSWQEVNQWVKYRDNVPEGFAQEEFQPQFNPEIENQKYNLQQHVDNITKDWTNKPDVSVWHSQDPDAPQSLKDNPNALGVYDASTGKVHLAADRIDSPETANAALFHEGLGHFGLAQQFGSRLDSVLKTLADRNVGKFGSEVDAWQKANPGAYGGDRIRAAEEVLAEASEKGQIKPSWQDALSAQVRQFGRKMGMKNLNYSDGEVRTILAMSHDAVINGKGRDVRGNGFRYKNFDITHTQDDEGNPVIKAVPTRELIDASDNYRQTIGVHAVPDVDGQWRVNNSFLPPDLRGKGLGREAYKALQDEVGGNLVSDSIVSDKAARLWEAAGATRSPAAYRDMIGQPGWATHDESPVYSDARFMQRKIEPEDVAEEAYERLGKDYVPRHRSWDEAQAAAEDRAIDPSFVRKIKAPEHLDKKLFIYDNAAHELNTKLNALAEKAKTVGLTGDEFADSIEAAANFSFVLAHLEENAGEAGRFLNALKAVRYSRNNLLSMRKALEETGTNLEGLTDPENMDRFLKRFAQLSQTNNPKGAAALARTVTKPYWEQYLTSFHFNAMLSGLSTHVKAPLDMMTGIAHNVIDHALASGIGKARTTMAMLTGRKVEPGIGASEVSSRIGGALRAVFDHEVHVKTLEALKTGEGSIVSPNGSSQSSSPMSTYGGAQNPRLPFKLSLPTDAITAQDTFFRSVAVSQNLYGLANRQAEKELMAAGGKYTQKDVSNLGAKYAMNPTKEMYETAKAEAEKSLLLNRNKLTGWLDAARQYRPNMSPMQRVGAFAATNLAPFIRVASNSIVTRTIERSPAALLMPQVWKDIRTGGPAADLAISKIIYGTIKFGLLWGMADKAKDMLTGETTDNSKKRQALEASGWRPDAVHENGQYNTGGTLAMSINPFDPHNSQAQLVASARQAFEKGMNPGDASLLALGSILRTFESESWVNDMTPAFSAATETGPSAKQKVAQFAGDEAKTWVPNILNQANRKFLDPNQRDTNPTDSSNISGKMVNSVKSALPGLSQELPQKMSVYGDPMPTGASVTGVYTAIPGLNGNGVPETKDPAEKELGRLEKSVTSTLVTPVNKTIKVAGQDVKLTPEQASEYQMYAGQSIVMTVKQAMDSGQWAKMSDTDRVRFVRDVEKDAKSSVRDALIQKEGWINDDQINTLRKQLNGQ